MSGLQYARAASERARRENEERLNRIGTKKKRKQLYDDNFAPHYDELSADGKDLFAKLVLGPRYFNAEDVARKLKKNREDAWTAICELLACNLLIESAGPIVGECRYSLHENYSSGCNPYSQYRLRPDAIEQYEAVENPEPPESDVDVDIELDANVRADKEVEDFIEARCKIGSAYIEKDAVLRSH